MRKEYASLRRRPFLTPVWLAVLAAMFTLAVAAWAMRAASTTLIVVMRHAEKAPDGTPDPPLSPAGAERAARLATIFGSGPKGLMIDTLFVTQWRRTGATAAPLASRLGVPVVTMPADDIRGLEARLLSDFRGHRVLVIAHSDSVPELVRDLARESAVPDIGEAEYGTLYVIAIPRWSRPTVLRMALP